MPETISFKKGRTLCRRTSVVSLSRRSLWFGAVFARSFREPESFATHCCRPANVTSGHVYSAPVSHSNNPLPFFFFHGAPVVMEGEGYPFPCELDFTTLAFFS